MQHPKDVGDHSALAAMLGMGSAGWSVYVPFGENTRADFIIDDGKDLWRVQCKTGRLRSGTIRFKTCSSYAHHSNPASRARDYGGEVDLFVVYCPETSGVYLVPIADVATKWNGALRVTPTLNGQRRRIRMADDYQIAAVSLTAKPRASSDARGPSA
jgi:hypothetical protein